MRYCSGVRSCRHTESGFTTIATVSGAAGLPSGPASRTTTPGPAGPLPEEFSVICVLSVTCARLPHASTRTTAHIAVAVLIQPR
jgi:hypothetical protein